MATKHGKTASPHVSSEKQQTKGTMSYLQACGDDQNPGHRRQGPSPTAAKCLDAGRGSCSGRHSGVCLHAIQQLHSWCLSKEINLHHIKSHTETFIAAFVPVAETWK